MTVKSLISEIALRCGDSEFKDFEYPIYKRAVYRCNREIAKHYGMFQKILTFTLKDMTNDLQADMILDLPDFKSEYLVNVNGIPMVKVANQLEPQYRYCYYMERIEGEWHFNYTLGRSGYYETGDEIVGLDITETMSKSIAERIEDGDYSKAIKNMDDEITICYTIIPNIESEIGEYDIDTKYEEEQLERAIYYMAKLGITQYSSPTSEKGLKWNNIYKMYKADKRSDYDPKIAKDSEFVKIQPWSPV